MLLKARQNQDFMQFMNMAAPMAQADPAAFAKTVNVSRSLEILAENQGVASGFLNTEEEKQQIEEQQAAQAAQMEAQAALETGAKAARDLGGAPQELQDSIGDQL
jgi:uncharacterized protein YutE (UPF0331/DUF86 family)